MSTILRSLLRKPGTKKDGGSFDAATIQAVWNKGIIVPGFDSLLYRQDTCGAWMQRNKYGDTTVGGYGWEIDHVVPVSKGGSDALSNLQPLHWQNNRRKADDYPNWSCAIP